VREGTLTVAKIGRRQYAKRSSVLALIEKLAVTRPTASQGVETDYVALATRGLL
jgi:hypothetical protein